MAKDRIALVLHGGAGARRHRDYSREIVHMRGLVEAARDALQGGASALDVATHTVAELEASGLYIAGRGASPNSEGRYELDASLMDGWSTLAGAVAALSGFESPIRVARAVMEATPHVMLAGSGAEAFARTHGFTEIAIRTPGSPAPARTRATARPAPWRTGPWAAWCAMATAGSRPPPLPAGCSISCPAGSATPRS
jgi:L-asparaginase/beta-aspartyl-peptidase (threonine type)